MDHFVKLDKLPDGYQFPPDLEERIYFDAAAHFCGEWDQEAFDPAYDTLPLDTFVPLLKEVFTRPANGFKVN